MSLSKRISIVGDVILAIGIVHMFKYVLDSQSPQVMYHTIISVFIFFTGFIVQVYAFYLWFKKKR
jgi:hypothetical protein